MTYNNDIAHCMGTGCPLAEKCRRFQLFKIWKEKEKKEYCLTPFVEPRYDDDNCENFFGDMIIETKYNIGQKVWVMHQKPIKVTIKRISCYCGRWGHLLKKEVMYLADNDCCFSEDLLFPTKEELINNL